MHGTAVKIKEKLLFIIKNTLKMAAYEPKHVAVTVIILSNTEW